MVEASPDLLQAVYRLKRAAEAELRGNFYYLAANEIGELIGSLGASAPPYAATNGAAISFGSALTEMRKATQSALSGNRYYMTANRLDALASLATRAQPASTNRTAPRVSFNGLAAASKARVEEVAAALGIALARQADAPSHAEAPETLSDGELERRSSEPCALAELAPPTLEPVAAAAVSAHTAALPQSSKTAPDLGPSAVESAPLSIPRAGPSASPETATLHEVQAPAPAHDRKAPSTGQTVEAQAEPASEPREQKTLFQLWLDLLFGRKD